MIDTDLELATNVCVIGAGPAGLTIALALHRAGIRTLVVERGDDHDESDSSEDLDGELGSGLPYFDLSTTRAAGLGGTSLLWPDADGLRSRPLDPTDFETRNGVPDSGWPISHDSLAAFYARAHELCNLSDVPYNPSHWATADAQELRTDGTDFETQMMKFGRDRRVFQKLAEQLRASDTVSFLTGATVLRLHLGPGRQTVDSAELALPGDRRAAVRAELFVLAAGGIENARLLLLSRTLSPAGLGNHNDVVGRFFQEHLRVQSGTWIPASADLIQTLSLYRQREVHGEKAIGVIVPRPRLLREMPVLNAAIYLRPSTSLRASDQFRSLGAIKSLGRKWGRGDDPLRAHFAELLRRPVRVARTVVGLASGRVGNPVIELSFQAEQAPNRESRVLLGDGRDRFGRPRARLDWRLTELDLASIRWIQRRFDTFLRATGLGQLDGMLGTERPPAPVRGFWHHMGTTRMHASPRLGVVDTECRVHGVANLYIAGGSVFPTSGYANPTLTLVALAIRLGDRLTSMLGRAGTVPSERDPTMSARPEGAKGPDDPRGADQEPTARS